MPNSVWASDRLVYRAVEDDDENFIRDIVWSDASTYTQLVSEIAAPPSKKDAREEREWLQKSVLGVIICLRTPEASSTEADTNGGSATDAAASTLSATDKASPDKADKPKPTPIGFVTLFDRGRNTQHHREVTCAISIATDYQNKGYGSEAMIWTLDWAFLHANMHRVDISAFAFNEGAVRLYKRLGFVLEGRMRECAWYNGRYWDVIQLGLLQREWQERYGQPVTDLPLR